MLPSGPANDASPVKFIDTGLDTFLKALEAKGAIAEPEHPQGGRRRRDADRRRWPRDRQAQRGGDARPRSSPEGSRLAATALGGKAGRTVQLEVADGRFLIKSLSSVTEL